MTRLSVKALRLYDENGLLPPAHVAPTSGFRYYRLEQASRAEMIKALRAVEMPLNEIRQVVDAMADGVAPDNRTRTFLAAHRQRLVGRLTDLEQMLAHFDSYLEGSSQSVGYDIVITQEQATSVAAVRFRTSMLRVAEDVRMGFETLVHGIGSTGSSMIGVPMIIYHESIDEVSDGDMEICVPISETFADQLGLYCRELEGGAMASTVHRGAYERITPAYHQLTRWISQSGYEIAGPPREVYLNDPKMVAREDLLTRIVFPIRDEGKVDS